MFVGPCKHHELPKAAGAWQLDTVFWQTYWFLRIRGIVTNLVTSRVLTCNANVLQSFGTYSKRIVQVYLAYSAKPTCSPFVV